MAAYEGREGDRIFLRVILIGSVLGVLVSIAGFMQIFGVFTGAE